MPQVSPMLLLYFTEGYRLPGAPGDYMKLMGQLHSEQVVD